MTISAAVAGPGEWVELPDDPEEMVAEARARGFDPVDAKEATALALLYWRIILGSSDDVALAA